MIEFTGERLIPGQVNPDLWAEHFSRYRYAAHFTEGKDILDIGCGAGYGTALLAERAHTARGIDIAADAVEFAGQHYAASNISFSTASATKLPFENQAFDLITAFEVIEHLEQWNDMLAEARRVLRPGGLFLVSTPNQAYYTESRGTAGANPYHVHEFQYQEFRQALLRHFAAATILLQNRVDAFAFYAHDSPDEASVVIDQSGTVDVPEEAYFFLGVCGIEGLPALPPFVFVPRASNLLRERERHIQGLQNQLQNQLQEFTALQEAHLQLQQHLKEKNAWAQSLDDELTRTRTQFADLQTEMTRELTAARAAHADLQHQFDERTTWALSLKEQVSQLEATVNSYRASRWVRLGVKLNVGPAFENGE